MKKDLGIIFGLFILIVILVIFGGSFTSTVFFDRPVNSGASTAKMSKISIKNLSVDASVASTSNERKAGLSKFDSLPLDQGMLFVFDHSDKYSIWMKNMKFAIDIIWLDEQKRVVDIVSNAPPQPGKKDSQLTVYRPRGEAMYILEVNAGLSSLNNVNVGDIANFSL